MTSLFNQNRPYHWDQFKGQDLPITYLRNRVKDGKHPNAILLQGEPGCGKSSLAFLYAKSVLDPDREKGQDCISSKDAYEKDYFNIIYHLVRDSSSTKDSMDNLISLAMSKPVAWQGMREDQYRRFIILDEVELIHSTTFSYLLNPLEYSPSTTTWILISMDSSKINPIVRSAIESRCKELKLRPLSTEDIMEMLPIEDKDLALLISRYSKGNARRAWSLLEVLQGANCLSMEKAEQYLLGSMSKESRSNFYTAFLSGNYKKAISIIKYWPEDRELVSNVLLNDLIRVQNRDLIPLLKEIKVWASCPINYPLEAVVMSSIELRPSFTESFNRWLDDSLHN